jgi:hypothetical protein
MSIFCNHSEGCRRLPEWHAWCDASAATKLLHVQALACHISGGACCFWRPCMQTCGTCCCPRACAPALVVSIMCIQLINGRTHLQHISTLD